MNLRSRIKQAEATLHLNASQDDLLSLAEWKAINEEVKALNLPCQESILYKCRRYRELGISDHVVMEHRKRMLQICVQVEETMSMFDDTAP